MNSLLSVVSLRRLQVFLTLCDTLHMARAAEVLGIASPALSQQIRALEQGLNVKLFCRSHRRLELTDAGTTFRDEARQIISRHELAINTVRRVSRGEDETLTLGYISSAMYDHLPGFLRTMHERHPRTGLYLKQGDMSGLSAMLQSSEVDAAVVCGLGDLPPNYESCVFSRKKIVCIMPSGHELSRMQSIPVSALQGVPLVSIRSSQDEAGAVWALNRFAEQQSVTLDVRWHVSAFDSVMGLVASGVACSVEAENVVPYLLPGISSRCIEGGNLEVEMSVVWNKARESRALKKFLHIVRESRQNVVTLTDSPRHQNAAGVPASSSGHSGNVVTVFGM